MANLIRRAAEELKKKNAQLQSIRANRKEQEMVLLSTGSSVGGAALAAYADKKWGKDGKPAELFDVVPANAGIGLGITAVAILAPKALPGWARAAVGGGGIGLMCGAAYRYVLDNVDVAPAQ